MARFAVRQAERFAEVDSMSLHQAVALQRTMTQATHMPALHHHWMTHKRQFEPLGITTEQGLEVLFLQHIRRHDLQWFTYISTRGAERMWLMIALDNNVVAQYNESRASHWGFYRHVDLDGYRMSGHGWWVEVEFAASLKVEKW